jgi:hypothetical protein
MIVSTLAPVARDPEESFTVTNLGDVNGDGTDDVLVLSPCDAQGYGRDAHGLATGRAWLISGKDLTVMASLVGVGNGPSLSACAVPDFDRDGVRDMAIAANGGVTIYSCRTGEVIRRLQSIAAGTNAWALSGSVACIAARGDGAESTLFTAWYTTSCGADHAASSTGRLVGYSLPAFSSVCCVDGGCVDEWLGTTLCATIHGNTRRVWAVARDAKDGPGGRKRYERDRLCCYDEHLTPRFQVVEEITNLHFGERLADAGDWNGDGIADLLVCSPGEWGGDDTVAGWVEVRSGVDGKILSEFRGKHGEEFGVGACVISDVDHDGHVDVVICCPDERGANQGDAMLMSGAGGKLVRLLPAEKHKRLLTLDCAPLVEKDAPDRPSVFLFRFDVDARSYSAAVVDPSTGGILREKIVIASAQKK